MVECPECGEEYKKLGGHWRYCPSHRPKLSEKQLEIITGSLMGDGTVVKSSGNYCLRIVMIAQNYLKYVDDIFGCLGTGVSLKQNAAESAKNSRNSRLNIDAKEENYSNQYCWRTRTHTKFSEFRRWYSSGKKVWPENIELTPTVLKHWYVGDGHYSNKNYQNNIKISVSNELGNKNKIDGYFERVGLPKPSNHGVYEHGYDIEWTVEDSYELWDYMGEPLPDFEYKWPEEYR